MKAKRFAVIFLFAVVFADGAVAKDLSKYPCNVFSYGACFRLPVGTRVELSIPADFQLYTISRGELPIATIYVGNAPQDIESSSLPKEIKTSAGTIKIYGSQCAEGKVNIVIKRHSHEGSTVHVSSFVPVTSSELRELLSSLRPCTPIKSGGQKCPVNDGWSKAIFKALSIVPEPAKEAGSR